MRNHTITMLYVFVIWLFYKLIGVSGNGEYDVVICLNASYISEVSQIDTFSHESF